MYNKARIAGMQRRGMSIVPAAFARASQRMSSIGGDGGSPKTSPTMDTFSGQL